MAAVIERVNRLEDLMAQLLEENAQTSRELREFKEEMRASALRTEQDTRALKNEMRAFKNEIQPCRVGKTSFCFAHHELSEMVGNEKMLPTLQGCRLPGRVDKTSFCFAHHELPEMVGNEKMLPTQQGYGSKQGLPRIC